MKTEDAVTGEKQESSNVESIFREELKLLRDLMRPFVLASAIPSRTSDIESDRAPSWSSQGPAA